MIFIYFYLLLLILSFQVSSAIKSLIAINHIQNKFLFM